MRKESSNSIFWATIIIMVAFEILLCIFLYNSNRQFNSFKEENRANFEKIASRAKAEPFQVNSKTKSDSTVVISSDELEKIGTYVNSLADEVKMESNRAESIIDKDIDRLNLYMAVGIGFMTLLGIFVPILVNMNTGQDLRDKQNRIDDEFKSVKRKFEAFESKTEKLNEQKNVVEGLVEKTKKVEINDANSQLQNAVGRFYYVGLPLMTKLIRDRDNSKLESLIIDIKEALEKCKNLEGHLIEENKSFRNNIEDFIIFLKSEDLRLTVIFDRRSDNGVFQNLINALQSLLVPSDNSEEEKYNNVNKALNEFIKIIRSRNEGQSAA